MDDYLSGESVEKPAPSLLMITLCENMKWAHLPVAGGIYDQRPEFIDDLYTYFMAKAEMEAKRAKDEERRAKAEAGRGQRSRGRGASRPR